MSHAFYEQRSGKFTIIAISDDGGQERAVHQCTCSAGKGSGRNNPSLEDVRSIGPLPRGEYVIREERHARFAAPSFRLVPHPKNRMHGRDGFFIHGGTNSAGCILMRYSDRCEVQHHKPDRLFVVPGSTPEA